MDAMRIHGGYGFTKDLPLERYYRDAPLMIIGEGTNEIQRLVIGRALTKEAGPATSHLDVKVEHFAEVQEEEPVGV